MIKFKHEWKLGNNHEYFIFDLNTKYTENVLKKLLNILNWIF